jgi:hypothetical protein
MRKAIRTLVVTFTLIGAGIVLSAQAIPRTSPPPTPPATTEQGAKPSAKPEVEKRTEPPKTGEAVSRTRETETQRRTEPPSPTRTPPPTGQAIPRPPQTEEQRRTPPPQGGRAIPRPPEPEVQRGRQLPPPVPPGWYPWDYRNSQRWFPIYPRYPYITGCPSYDGWVYPYRPEYWNDSSAIVVRVFNPERNWVDIEDDYHRVVVQGLCPGGNITILVDQNFSSSNYLTIRLIAKATGIRGLWKKDEFEIRILDSRGRPIRIQREYSWVIRLR